jgi:hypothetical protein
VNLCCREKAKSIIFSVCVNARVGARVAPMCVRALACVWVVLGRVRACNLAIQHAMRIRHIVICGLSGSTTFFDIIALKTKFSKKKNYWTYNVY